MCVFTSIHPKYVPLAFTLTVPNQNKRLMIYKTVLCFVMFQFINAIVFTNIVSLIQLYIQRFVK